MRRAVLLTLAVTTMLAPAAPAAAATPTDKRVAALQKQVKALQKEVKTLRTLVIANYAADTCLAATTADVFQATWTTIDAYTEAQSTTRLFGSPVSGGLPPVDDRGACRTTIGGRASNAVAPTATIFAAIVRFLVG